MATLHYLDTLYEKGDMDRSQYFKKNLSRVVTKLPKVRGGGGREGGGRDEGDGMGEGGREGGKGWRKREV